MINIEIVESDLLSQYLLLQIFSKHQDFQVVRVAETHSNNNDDVSVAQAKSTHAHNQADVSILGIRKKDQTSFELFSKLYSDKKMILLSEEFEDKFLMDALESGVCGILERDEIAFNIINVIKNSSNERTYITKSPAEQLLSLGHSIKINSPVILNNERGVSQLDDLERTILLYVVMGFSKAEVARALKISPNTVASRIKSAYAWAGVTNRTDAYDRFKDLMEEFGK